MKLVISAFIFTVFIELCWCTRRNKAENHDDSHKILATVAKYNQTIEHQKEKIQKLQEMKNSLTQENDKLKEQIAKLSQVEVEKTTPSSTTSPAAYTNIDSSLFALQMQMQIAREKELRETVEAQLREVGNSQRKMEEMYWEIKNGVKDKLENLEKNLEKYEKSNYNIQEKVFALERDKEKAEMIRKMTKPPWMNLNGDIIEPECVNRNSCHVCLEDPKCVWCSLEKKCKIGDLSGPYDGTCTKFDYQSCSYSRCNSYSSCFECVWDESCGWCGEYEKCVDGTDVKPSSVICTANYIHKRNYQRCPYNRRQLRSDK